MKKISLLLVFVLLLCLITGLSTTASATTDIVTSADSEYASAVLEDFLTANPSRIYDTIGENQAGEYIFNYLGDIGFSVEGQLLSCSTAGNSYNVVATIDTDGTDETIIIGAHYDALYEGATDNGTGVAALLLIAEQLYMNRDSLQCDIVIIAFAGEEYGLLGSNDYVSKMSDSDIANTKLMINIDSIGMGDQLYVYGELKTTDYIDALIEGASSSSNTLSYKPLSSGIDFTWDYYGYGYYEKLQGSDHTSFALAGIPTAFYFSGSFDTLSGVYVESTTASNCVMNTNADTWDKLTSSGVDYASRIATVVDSVCNTIISDSTALLDAPNQVVADGWYSYTAVSITYYVLGVAVLIAGIVYYKKLTRNAIISGSSGGAGAAQARHIFTKPDSEDIFDLGD